MSFPNVVNHAHKYSCCHVITVEGNFIVFGVCHLGSMHINIFHPHTNAYTLHFTSLDNDDDASIQDIMKRYCSRE